MKIRNYSHPFLVYYGDHQFTLRTDDKGNTVTHTPLASISIRIFLFQQIQNTSEKEW